MTVKALPASKVPLSRRQRHAVACTASLVAESAVQKLVDSGKLNKTALGKLPVAVLREECALAGLPGDGLKPVLVERLLCWAAAQWDGRYPRATAAPVQAADGNVNGAATVSTPVGGTPEAQGQGAGRNSELQDAAPTGTEPASTAALLGAQQAAAVGAKAAPSSSAGAGPNVGTIAAAAVSASSAASSTANSAGASSSLAGTAPAEVALTWLGTSSGNPTSRRNVSGIVVRFGEELALVDVGEGSRNQLRRAGFDPARVRRVFITHLHGDHCFGLCGLLAEICEARLGTPLQQDPICVFGPLELHRLVAGTAQLGGLQLTTSVVVVGWVLDPAKARRPQPVDAGSLLQLALVGPDQGSTLPRDQAARWQAEYDQGSDQVVRPGLTWTTQLPGCGVRVVAAQLQHRVPCWGYVFQEPAQLVPPPLAAAPGSATAAAAGLTYGGAEPRLAAAAVPATTAAENERLGGAAHGAVLEPRGQQQQRGQQAAAGQEGAQQGQEGQQQWVRRGRKVVVLGDTCDSRAIAQPARNCDVVSHEATFMRGMEKKARIATHSTSEQAGDFARMINARSLVLTHFSARYDTARKEGKAMGGNRRQQQDRGSRRAAGGSKAEQFEQDLDEGELQRLVRDAQNAFGSRRVFLASDYFTFKVHPHEPQPLPPPGSAAAVVRTDSPVTATNRPPPAGWKPGPAARGLRLQQQQPPAQRYPQGQQLQQFEARQAGRDVSPAGGGASGYRQQ
ncbi:hypothetical protein N2152v2_001185 [Parachlorella kessleri]